MSEGSWPRVDGLRTLALAFPGELRQRLTGLVLHGSKRATAGLLEEYAAEGEELEHVGEVLVVVDDDGAEIGRIRVTRVEVVPFAEVTDEFARDEGEGYGGHADWAVSHREFWEATGAQVDDGTPVVCLWFDLLGAEPVRIAMWSGPRTLSTATMRAWENRADTVVVDEPLYAYYLAAPGWTTPAATRCWPASRPTGGPSCAELAQGPVPAAIAYQKHMTHHVLPEVDLDAFAGLRHAFLVRDPRGAAGQLRAGARAAHPRRPRARAAGRAAPPVRRAGGRRRRPAPRPGGRAAPAVRRAGRAVRPGDAVLAGRAAALRRRVGAALVRVASRPRPASGRTARQPADLPAHLEELAARCRPSYDEMRG